MNSSNPFGKSENQILKWCHFFLFSILFNAFQQLKSNHHTIIHCCHKWYKLFLFRFSFYNQITKREQHTHMQMITSTFHISPHHLKLLFCLDFTSVPQWKDAFYESCLTLDASAVHKIELCVETNVYHLLNLGMPSCRCFVRFVLVSKIYATWLEIKICWCKNKCMNAFVRCDLLLYLENYLQMFLLCVWVEEKQK